MEKSLRFLFTLSKKCIIIERHKLFQRYFKDVSEIFQSSLSALRFCMCGTGHDKKVRRILMKKGSSRNRRKAPPRREAQPRREARPPSCYPVRDNVYSFEQERQRKQRQVQTRKSQGYPPPAATAKKQKKQRKKRKRAYMVMPLLIFAMIALY